MPALGTKPWRFISKSSAVIAALLCIGLLHNTVVSAVPSPHLGITSLRSPGAGQGVATASVIVGFPSNRSITLLIPTATDPGTAKYSQRYTLSSLEDKRYQQPEPALLTGLEQQVVGFSDASTALIETRLHLLFDSPLMPATRYQLHGPGLANTGMAFHYQQQVASSSIQVNQLGYAPEANKYAYIGNWLGTAGPLPIDDKNFLVIDALSGATVYRGALTPRAMADPWSGNDVYQADFSSLRRPGRYYVSLPGLGSSDRFTIASNVYDIAYRTTARYFYHHRNHTPVTAPWAAAGYERDAGVAGKADGIFHPRVADSPLGSGEQGYREITRGWFDAGDYGQYIVNAAPIWYVLGAAIDIMPDNFRDGDLDIPESGNGLPDMLDELEWGMDWALSMQDQADGGVWFRIASERWDSTLPAAISVPRYIGEKTTHATASFAALAAIHSRLLMPYRPARAKQTLAAAEKAWDFLENHQQWPAEGEQYSNPEGTHAGTYADKSALDNSMWAAAELYRATGEARYHNTYKKLAEQVPVDPTAVVSFHDQSMAALWAYLNANWPDRDEALGAAARDAVLAGANWRLRVANDHPFRAAVHPHLPFLGWGSFAHSTRSTLPLLQAWTLTGDDAFRRGAWQTPHPQLGANPQALSYITGLGQRSPRYPLSKLSQHDGVDAPLPGIPVNGPHYYLPAIWASTQAVNKAYYPPNSAADTQAASGIYPPLRRFTDSEHLPPMTEPTVAEVASTAVAYALLRGELPAGGSSPRHRESAE